MGSVISSSIPKIIDSSSEYWEVSYYVVDKPFQIGSSGFRQGNSGLPSDSPMYVFPVWESTYLTELPRNGSFSRRLLSGMNRERKSSLKSIVASYDEESPLDSGIQISETHDKVMEKGKSLENLEKEYEEYDDTIESVFKANLASSENKYSPPSYNESIDSTLLTPRNDMIETKELLASSDKLENCSVINSLHEVNNQPRNLDSKMKDSWDMTWDKKDDQGHFIFLQRQEANKGSMDTPDIIAYGSSQDKEIDNHSSLCNINSEKYNHNENEACLIESKKLISEVNYNEKIFPNKIQEEIPSERGSEELSKSRNSNFIKNQKNDPYIFSIGKDDFDITPVRVLSQNKDSDNTDTPLPNRIHDKPELSKKDDVRNSPISEVISLGIAGTLSVDENNYVVHPTDMETNVSMLRFEETLFEQLLEKENNANIIRFEIEANVDIPEYDVTSTPRLEETLFEQSLEEKTNADIIRSEIETNVNIPGYDAPITPRPVETLSKQHFEEETNANIINSIRSDIETNVNIPGYDVTSCHAITMNHAFAGKKYDSGNEDKVPNELNTPSPSVEETDEDSAEAHESSLNGDSMIISSNITTIKTTGTNNSTLASTNANTLLITNNDISAPKPLAPKRIDVFSKLAGVDHSSLGILHVGNSIITQELNLLEAQERDNKNAENDSYFQDFESSHENGKEIPIHAEISDLLGFNENPPKYEDIISNRRPQSLEILSPIKNSENPNSAILMNNSLMSSSGKAKLGNIAIIGRVPAPLNTQGPEFKYDAENSLLRSTAANYSYNY